MASNTPIPDLPKWTFLGGDGRLARRVGKPVRRFLHVEASGGVVLLLAAIAALVWANSPWSDSYYNFWHTDFELVIGSYHMGGESHHLTLETLVNDALMAIFFFVVGLEIKRELVSGQLKDPKAAALPVIAAIGGMVFPAVVYVAFNSSGDAASGWGIPMATDIAFAVGVISLLGDRIGRPLKVFLLSLAIADDIGAIIIIAIFYSSDLSMSWFITALIIMGIIILLRRLHIWYIPIYIALGTALWLATFESGVHATIAGVVLGLATPAKPQQTKEEGLAALEWLRDKGENIYPVDVRLTAMELRESQVSVAERIESALHPISSFIIIPIFALANAGVNMGDGLLQNAASSPVTWGVGLGLIIGKIFGITFMTWLGMKLPFTTAPSGLNFLSLLGLAATAGIGFTVSLFITNLAFDDMTIINESKIGILFASVLAGIFGLLLLRAGSKNDSEVVTSSSE
ncbi:MAG: Na+/H+ antiporter NhaA [Acidimicrobiaceae bacterium]|nr:Na+/H+ antiporter NhaA [Acidimicrobiaceae bacterium]|tara:strand:+ start:852 stop:2228 length:1377 start_codon:yes stop_codon:yes gene_type:complete